MHGINKAVEMRKHLSAPILVDFNITNRCNLYCPFCYANSSSKCTEELDFDKIKSILIQLNEMNVQRVSLVGGEPLIREDFFEILTVCDTLDFSLIINTNATLLNEEMIERLKNHNISGIMVSLDGPRDVHDKIRCKGAYDKVVKSIQLLKKHKVPHATLFTLCSLNAKYLIQTLLSNQEIGIKNTGIMMVCPTGRADENLLVDYKEWSRIFNTVTDLIADGTISSNIKFIPPNESKIFWELFLPLKDSNRISMLKTIWGIDPTVEIKNREVSCKAAIDTIAIDHLGNVYGCDLMISYPELRAGNLQESSLYDIWHHSEIFKYMRNISIENIDEPCSTCDNEWCGGGCRVSAFSLSKGNILAADYRCPIVRGEI
ncbi:MAG: radical SAM protein [Desulfobacterales bacterium]